MDLGGTCVMEPDVSRRAGVGKAGNREDHEWQMKKLITFAVLLTGGVLLIYRSYWFDLILVILLIVCLVVVVCW